MKKRHLLLTTGLLVALCAPALSFAQAYPAKPIRIIVPFPAGGATDLFARVISQKLGEKLGSSVVVENKPGAGGTIGADLAAKSAPDGYSVLLATTSTHAIAPSLNAKIPYDVIRDFTPIIHVGNAPSIMLVPNNSPAKTVKEWVDMAKKNPGKLNYASSGNGTIVHLTSELFKSHAGLFITHIPYKGTALAIPDLISGNLDVLFDSLPTGLPHVKDGKLRALGVTTLKRSPLAPDLPAIAETLPGFESNTWFGLYGPKGLPQDVLEKVNKAVNQALADTDVKDKLARLGIEPVGGTNQQFATMAKQDKEKWHRIITERKITSE